MKSNSGRFQLSNKVVNIINYMLLIIAVIVVIGPLLILFNIAFKSNGDYLNSGLLEIPKSIYLTNFMDVFLKDGLLKSYFNTILIILVAVTGSVFLGSMVAYALTRFEFKFKKIVWQGFIAAAIIPTMTTQVAIFTIIKSLHLYNTLFSAMILFIGADIVQIYIFLQFIEKLPKDLDESAIVDGANYFRIYFSIILPQLKPAIATVVILKTIGIYNDFVIPFLYMPKRSLQTVSTFLFTYQSGHSTEWNRMAAAIIMIMIPTLIMYLFLQRLIFAGITEGAVKG